MPESIRACKTLSDFYSELEPFVLQLGFDGYAITVFEDERARRAVAQLNNYPAAWLKEYTENNYLSDDPIHKAISKSFLPVIWSDLEKNSCGVDISGHNVLVRAKKYGLVSGISIKIICSSDFYAVISFFSHQPHYEMVDKYLTFSHEIASLADSLACHFITLSEFKK